MPVSAPVLDETLLSAGQDVLTRFGYQGATAERIAEAAGRSRVTLHRHGVNKDVILAALAERAIERYRSAMWPVLTGEGTGRERLQAGLDALCQQAEESLELLVALRAQTDAVFHEDETAQPLTRSVFTEPLERLLRDGEADGSLRLVDAPETATVLFNLVGWTYVHLRTGHRWPPKRARERVLDIAMYGLIEAPTARGGA